MKCIELSYITKSEKNSNGVGNDTVTVLRLPAEFLQNDEITDQDVLQELLSAIDDENHLWHDIAMSLVQSTPTSQNLVEFPIGGISVVENDIDRNPFTDKLLEFRDNGYQVHELKATDLMNVLGKTDVDKSIKTLLKNQNPKILFLDKPMAIDGRPIELSKFEETANGSYDRVNNIITLSADKLTAFNDIIDGNYSRIDVNQNMKDVLFHELIHANYHEAISAIDIDVKKLSNKLVHNTSIQTSNILDSISKLKGNEAKQEFFTYLLQNSNFREEVLNQNPELSPVMLESLLGNISPELYNLALNVLAKNQKSFEVKPDSINIESLPKQSKTDSDLLKENDNPIEGVVNITNMDVDENDSGILFNVTSNDLPRQFIERKFVKNYKAAEKMASDIFKNFEASVTGSSNTKYRINYGDETMTVSFKERMHLHNLQQNDIIRVISDDYDEKTKTYKPNTEGKTHYLPVISVDYFNNELKVLVATKNGKVAPVDPDQIISFRKHKGIYNADKDSNKNQRNLAELFALAGAAKGTKKTFTYGKDVLSTDVEPIYHWMEKGDNNIPVLRKQHYLEVSFGKNARRESAFNPENNKYKNNEDLRYDSFYFDQVIPGDFIKSSFTNKDGKKVVFVAPIVQVHGDLIEVLKSPEVGDVDTVDLSKHKFETFYVTKESVDSIYMSKKAHNDFFDMMNSRLSEATKNGFNKAEGLQRIKFKNYSSTNQHISGDKANWNDLTIGYAENKDGSFNEDEIAKLHKTYSEWRKNIGDNIANMRLKDLKDPKDIQFFKRHKAIERRRQEFSKVGPGTFIQLETLYSEEGVAQPVQKESAKPKRGRGSKSTWVANETKKANRDYKTVAGWVISRKGDYVKVNIKVPVWKDGKIVGENFKEVSVNILNAYPKSIPGDGGLDAYAVRAIYKDNSESLKYINFFSGLLQTIVRNRNDKSAMFKNGFNNGTTFDNFSYLLNYNNRKENVKVLEDVLDGDVSWNTITGLDELYDLRHYHDSATADQKLRDFRRLKEGSIVLTYKTKNGERMQNPDGTYQYYSNIVVGKDAEGYPLIGYQYSGEYEYDVDGETKNKYTKDEIVVRPVSFSEVSGVGYANKAVKIDDNVQDYLDKMLDKTNKNRPVYKATSDVKRITLFEADNYIKRQRSFDVKNYIESKKIKTYDSANDPNLVKIINNMNAKKVPAKIAELYVNDKGVRSLTRTSKSDKVVYWAAFPKKGNQKYDVAIESTYSRLFGDSIKNTPTLAIISNLREGDVITKTYKDKDGKTRDIDMIVSYIDGNKIYGYMLYMNKGTKKTYDENGNDITPYLAKSISLDVRPLSGEKTSAKDTRKGLQDVKEISLGRKDGEFSNVRVETIKNGTINWEQKRIIDNIPVKGRKVETVEQRKERHKNAYENKLSFVNRTKPKSDSKQKQSEPSKKSIAEQVQDAQNNKTSGRGRGRGKQNTPDVPFSKNTTEGFVKSTNRPKSKEMAEFVKRISDMYNVPVEMVDSNTILEQFGNTKNNMHKQRAFVLNDTIYINTDYATLAEPIHELGHLVLNGLKITDPKTYSDIMDTMETHPNKSLLQSYYSELDNERMNEELFVTLLGERFNVTNGTDRDTKINNYWKKENESFFKRIANKIKQFFAKLFNIDSNRFFSTEPVNFMNMSINEILDNFNNRIMDGSYKNVVKSGIERAKFENTGSFLVNSNGETSGFFKSLIANDLDMDFAINSWINLKSGIFAKWDDGTVLKDDFNEPKVLYRNSKDILQEQDTEGLGDAVLVKGDVTEVADGFTTDESNILSIYALNVDESIKEVKPLTMQDFADNKGLSLIGSPKDLNKSLVKLREQFPNKSFTLYNLYGDIFYIKEYDKPSEPILNLRELLFNKNIIKALC